MVKGFALCKKNFFLMFIKVSDHLLFEFCHDQEKRHTSYFIDAFYHVTDIASFSSLAARKFTAKFVVYH